MEEANDVDDTFSTSRHTSRRAADVIVFPTTRLLHGNSSRDDSRGKSVDNAGRGDNRAAVQLQGNGDEMMPLVNGDPRERTQGDKSGNVVFAKSKLRRVAGGGHIRVD